MFEQQDKIANLVELQMLQDSMKLVSNTYLSQSDFKSFVQKVADELKGKQDRI